MTTPNSTTEAGGLADDEIGAAWDAAKTRMSHDPYTPKEAFWAGALFAQSRASAQGGGDLIERIAKHWDGCMFDSPGEGDLDIGAAIRQNAKHFATPPATTGMKESLVGDAERWEILQKALNTGHLAGPGHGHRIKLIETSPMYGDEKEVDVRDLVKAIDAIRAGRKG